MLYITPIDNKSLDAECEPCIKPAGGLGDAILSALDGWLDNWLATPARLAGPPVCLKYEWIRWNIPLYKLQP